MSVARLQQTEAQFQQAVIDLARALGWLVYHTRDSRGSEAGFPDLVMARDNRLAIVELKTESGRESAAQERWLDALTAVAYPVDHPTAFALSDGVKFDPLRSRLYVSIWRPRHWSEIERVLAR